MSVTHLQSEAITTTCFLKSQEHRFIISTSSTFTPQTSAYLNSVHGNVGSAIEKEKPYTPAIYGEGTGFNSASSYVSWLPPGEIEGSSTTKDAYPPPATRFTPKGLDCLQYTLNMQKA